MTHLCRLLTKAKSVIDGYCWAVSSSQCHSSDVRSRTVTVGAGAHLYLFDWLVVLSFC